MASRHMSAMPSRSVATGQCPAAGCRGPWSTCDNSHGPSLLQISSRDKKRGCSNSMALSQLLWYGFLPYRSPEAVLEITDCWRMAVVVILSAMPSRSAASGGCRAVGCRSRWSTCDNSHGPSFSQNLSGQGWERSMLKFLGFIAVYVVTTFSKPGSWSRNNLEQAACACQ